MTWGLNLLAGVLAVAGVAGIAAAQDSGEGAAGDAAAAEDPYIWLEEIPVFPHVRNLAARGLVPGGAERNLEAAAEVRWDPSLDATERIICVDAQTSGGLLMAVAPERHDALIEALRREGTPAAAKIGRVNGAEGVVHVSRSRK